MAGVHHTRPEHGERINAANCRTESNTRIPRLRAEDPPPAAAVAGVHRECTRPERGERKASALSAHGQGARREDKARAQCTRLMHGESTRGQGAERTRRRGQCAEVQARG